MEFLNDYHNDSDYKVENVENDDDSEYIPDAEDELEDDHILNFDDDDYAEESEEEDDDYEDSETDDIEDKKFVSDYFNDPDYEPDEDDNIDLYNFSASFNCPFLCKRIASSNKDDMAHYSIIFLLINFFPKFFRFTKKIFNLRSIIRVFCAFKFF